tara:strand:- start:321 stop:587 length:267 start_codon:yes stop_codon:yes gene_type:complete
VVVQFVPQSGLEPVVGIEGIKAQNKQFSLLSDVYLLVVKSHLVHDAFANNKWPNGNGPYIDKNTKEFWYAAVFNYKWKFHGMPSKYYK